MSKEAMKLALEALENAVNDSADFERINFDECEKAITALQEALASEAIEQPAPPPECQTEAEKTAFAFGWFKALESVRQQPVQQDSTCSNTLRAQGKAYPRTCKKCGLGPCIADRVQPAQRTWVGLTDDERRHLRKCNQSHDAFARAVEALLKEKNSD